MCFLLNHEKKRSKNWKAQYFLIDAVQSGLQGFPFPAFPVFVVIDFDFLDAFDGFNPVALVFGGQFEVFPVDFLPDVQKYQYPAGI